MRFKNSFESGLKIENPNLIEIKIENTIEFRMKIISDSNSKFNSHLKIYPKSNFNKTRKFRTQLKICPKNENSIQCKNDRKNEIISSKINANAIIRSFGNNYRNYLNVHFPIGKNSIQIFETLPTLPSAMATILYVFHQKLWV